MHLRNKNIDQLINRQIVKWNTHRRYSVAAPNALPLTVTVSRETGCCGSEIAARLAQELKFDLFDHEIIQRIAEQANVSEAVVATLDERWRSTFEDWIANWANQRRLWLDDYLRLLVTAVTAIGRHGNAVVVGRGASFILGADPRFNVWRLRLIAPLHHRAEQLARVKNTSVEDALKYVSGADADRRAFVARHFGAAIDDAANYDLTLNTENLTVDDAIAILAASVRTRVTELQRAAV